MSSGRSARSLAIEALVIVGSILLAFAIDAWWDEREQTERREAVLGSLRSDIALARADMDRVLPLSVRSLNGLAELQRLSDEGPIPEALWPKADTLLAYGFGAGSFDPPMGTIDALISSGELQLLQDPELTAELTALPGRLVDLNREAVGARDIALAMLAAMQEDGIGFDLGFVLEMSAGRSRGADSASPWNARPPRAGRLFHTDEYRSRVSAAWMLSNNYVGLLNEIDEALTNIEERIRE